MFGISCAAPSILASADASHIGWPTMRAPRLSAADSRVRLIAVCTNMPPCGARIIIAIEPMRPGPLLLSRLPPKNMPNCATIEIAHVKNHDTLLMTITATIAGDGHQQRVVIFHMREFMGNHPAEFLAAER